MKMLVLVVALLSGQTIYEWVDGAGQRHFTDDPATIPQGARRRATDGAELMIIPAAPRSDAGVRAAPAAAAPTQDSCARAKERISLIEKKLEQARAATVELQEREGRSCQEVLMLQGQPGFARCMASRTEAAPPSEAVKKDLEAAQETLRRAQVNGCR